MLTRIKNAHMVKKDFVVVNYSKLCCNALEVLKRYGYIENYKVSDDKRTIKLHLKYINGSPAIRDFKLISKPGRRIYRKKSEIKKVMGGFGIAIITTSKGVMSDIEARKNNLGGEVLAYIY
ncbi:MAG: 30S ribosomal protein S8 [bacterium]|nr:30S ribosomal protein S8 [bacterium]